MRRGYTCRTRHLFLDGDAAAGADRSYRIVRVTRPRLVVEHYPSGGLLPDLKPERIDAPASSQVAVNDRQGEVVPGAAVDFAEAPELRLRVRDDQVVVVQGVELEVAEVEPHPHLALRV